MTKPKDPYGWHYRQVRQAYDLIHPCGHYGHTANRARDPGKAVDALRQKARDCRACRTGRPQDGRRTRNPRVELI